MMLRAHKREWHQERSFDTLPQCASYRERQADEMIKRMETVPEGSPDYKIYDHAATLFIGQVYYGVDPMNQDTTEWSER